MTEPRGPDDLTPEEAALLEDYLAGRLAEGRHGEVEQSILASDRLAEAVYSDVNVHAALEESRGRAAAPQRRAPVVPLFGSRWARVALPLAAALALLVLSPRFFGERHGEDDTGFGGTPHFRSGTLQPAPGVRALAPTGDVIGPPHFTWSKSAGAEDYRVEILRASGGVLVSATTRDTSITLAPAALHDARDVAAWRVVPRTGGVDGAASAAVPIRLRDAAP